ncbi:RHS repeat domain-containing protein [Butyricimonas synergistica]|uniref:RHS repeat domain-containing protein n=1 Tax=Butyricimonas synergistica TaxID=544644 RepID=UPI0022E65A87|nr:DUF6443 domain-containing protein [Butyricimonas synergistica]
MKTIYYISLFILIISKGVYGQTNIQIFNVSGKSEVYVNEISTITLSGSEIGVTYDLINSSGSVLMTLEGTGNPLKFTEVLKPNCFRVRGCKGNSRVEMSGSVTISYKDLFYNATRFVPSVLEFSQDGETLETTLEPETGINYNNFVEFFILCDEGLIKGWDASAFRVEPIGFTLHISTEINTSGSEKNSTVYLGDAKLVLKQKPGVDSIANVHIYPVEKFQEGRNFEIVLGATQEPVTYKLLNIMGSGMAKKGTGERLVFTVNQPGWYYIYGEYDFLFAELGVVKVIPQMEIYTLSGSGTTQEGQSVTLTLSGSQRSLEYELLRYGETYQTKTGTGSPLSFTVGDPGIYTVKACFMGEYTKMNGSALIDVIGGVNITESENNEVRFIFQTPTTKEDSVKYMADINYLDGFKRVKQSIQTKVGNSNSDIIIPYVYGPQGRIEKEYLPYAKSRNNGAYDANYMNTANWNIYGETEAACAFKKIEYDNSSLDRIIKQIGSGKNWHNSGKGISKIYATNIANEVRLYRVSSTNNLEFNNAYYAPGTLSKEILSDENGNIVEKFTTLEGKVILEVRKEGNTRLETYQVYDDYGQLRYLLSPETTFRLGSSTNETILEQSAYYYEYDKAGRLIIKRLPGCAPVYMVYDRKDRLVLSQNGKQRDENPNKWSYSVYDRFNRVIENGEIIISGSTSHSTLQTTVSSSDNYIPLGNRFPLQYILYDSYTATENISILPFQSTVGYDTGYRLYVAGLVTSIKSKVLGMGTEKWLTTTTYYDDRCRVIQRVSDNLHGQKSRVNMKYDFTGNIVRQRESHGITTNQTDVLETEYTYDNRGKLLTTVSRLNNGSPAIVSYNYDGLGRLITKKYGNIVETMTYNMRGWLTSKESAPFKMKLRYENPEGGSAVYWNGNISEWEWQQGTSTALMYGFTYDGVNRLAGTTQKQKNGANWITLPNNYLETGLTYDRNGNIKTLQRTAGGTTVDNLTYTYTGNQLTSLTESVRTSSSNDIYLPGSVATGGYAYDLNGNMINDSRRALNLSYNVLNLLSEVKTGSTTKARYSYLADGAKLQVRDADGNGFDYLGSLTYSNSSAELQLESANFGDGVIRTNVSNSGETEVNYFMTDHLGSVRAIVDNNGVVKERNDYYPFGAKHMRGDYPQLSANRYKYNGKENQVTGDLDYLDYGARMYDRGLGRWFNIDPCAEDYTNIAPYVFVANNSLNLLDTDGRKIIFVNGLLAAGSPEGGQAYWNRSFVSAAQDYFKDRTIPYFTNIEHDIYSSAMDRQIAGYKYAKDNYGEITSNMKPGEAIRLVSHSMGGAFAAGIRDYFLEQGHIVDYAIFINTYQRGRIKMKDSDLTTSIDFLNTNDPVIKTTDLLFYSTREIIEHAITIRVKSDKDFKYVHKGPISSGKEFWNLMLLILGNL